MMRTASQIAALRAAGFGQWVMVIFYLTGKLNVLNLPGRGWALETELRHLTEVGRGLQDT